jgi:HipA-like protein
MDVLSSPKPAETGEAEAKESPLLPKSFRRAAVRGTNKWNLPRSFVGFRAADPSLSIRGAAPKCLVVSETDPHTWYMAKSAEKWGVQETLTELFISRLGERLGFPVAHSGAARVDGELRFVSRSFLGHDEKLVHGSVLIESFFGDTDLDNIGKNPWDEQRTYDIDLIDELLHQVCGEDYPVVIQGMVEMLIFDTLIGSNDRHMQNWGIITTATAPQRFRFSPIFDSARALLWDYDEKRLEKLRFHGDNAIRGYANRARPKIGCATFGKAVNHFNLLAYLLKKYGSSALIATKVSPDKVRVASEVLQEYPFRSKFTQVRKEMLRRVLHVRSEWIADALAKKRGEHLCQRL